MDKGSARSGVRAAVIWAACALFVACAINAQAPAPPPVPAIQPAPAAKSQTSAPGAPAALQAPATPDKTTTASSAPATLPAWDVSTIKPSDPNARGSMLMFTPDGIKITNVPLFMIVREGFQLEDDRIFGGPGWAKTSMFDIEAKVAPEDAPKLKDLSFDQRLQMMIILLQDRCGLKFHHEMRDLPVYDLVVAKGGSKLTASKPDPPADDGDEKHGNHRLMMHGRGHIESTGTDMHGLTRILSGELKRTVIDKTGLKGDFDYKLDWTPDNAPPPMAKAGDAGPGENSSASDNAGPSLFTALEEQLGLKLESSKGPVDVIVIDQLEQPTAN
jgi:uncharacterized protein (TIGR03435 family)